MKNKLLIFLILVIFFLPAVSGATITDPTINLTIIVNTQGIDNSFYFRTAYYDTNYQSWYGEGEFYINTINLSGSKVIHFSSSDKWRISQAAMVGLKLNNISCISDNPNQTFTYESNYYGVPTGVIINPTMVDGNITCTFNNKKVNSRTPVLIVPGVTGTELNNTSGLLWPDIPRLMYTPGDTFLDPLAFNSDLTQSDSSVYISNVIRNPSNLFDYTDSLIKEFGNQGYIENQDLFTFPYDWRYGVSAKNADGLTNSDLLKNKIADILAQTGADKVDVVAHSMGGLIVKKYVQDNQASNHIGKAVFVGVPETGAPKAVKALVQGDNFGVSFGPVGLNDAEMKKLSENMPAAYDLLPSQQYYNLAGSFVSKVDFTQDPNGAETDLNYEGFKNYLTQDYNLNSQALDNSVNLHSSAFDNFDLRTAGVDLYSIDGCKTGTMTNFLQVDYKDVFGNEHTSFDRVDLKTGDGTVPIQSSTNLPIDQNKKYYALALNHSKLLSADGSRQEIVNLISGSTLAVGSNITQDVGQCQLNGKAIEVFSPVDVAVQDSLANKLGLANGNIINEIPGASYEVMGEHKFIYLPAGQSYSVALQGTGAGTFTIKAKDIINGEIIKTETFENIPVTVDLTGAINLSGSLSNATTLTIKNTPTSWSKTISPTSTTSTVPIVKKQCTKKGWKDFGTMFKNQKECFNFVSKK